jgi:hypothetical protein
MRLAHRKLTIGDDHNRDFKAIGGAARMMVADPSQVTL